MRPLFERLEEDPSDAVTLCLGEIDRMIAAGGRSAGGRRRGETGWPYRAKVGRSWSRSGRTKGRAWVRAWLAAGYQDAKLTRVVGDDGEVDLAKSPVLFQASNGRSDWHRHREALRDETYSPSATALVPDFRPTQQETMLINMVLDGMPLFLPISRPPRPSAHPTLGVGSVVGSRVVRAFSV